MTRALIVGSTDYSSQSLEEIKTDLDAWVSSLSSSIETLESYKQLLIESNYWTSVYGPFRSLVEKTIYLFRSYKNEIESIVVEMNSTIQDNHVKRLLRIGENGLAINLKNGSLWHRQYPDNLKDYNNDQFGIVESIYGEIGDMAGDLQDLCNVANKLGDFIGFSNKTNKSIISEANDVIDLKPNFFGLGININALFKKIFKKTKQK